MCIVQCHSASEKRKKKGPAVGTSFFVCATDLSAMCSWEFKIYRKRKKEKPAVGTSGSRWEHQRFEVGSPPTGRYWYGKCMGRYWDGKCKKMKLEKSYKSFFLENKTENTFFSLKKKMCRHPPTQKSKSTNLTPGWEPMSPDSLSC